MRAARIRRGFEPDRLSDVKYLFVRLPPTGFLFLRMMLVVGMICAFVLPDHSVASEATDELASRSNECFLNADDRCLDSLLRDFPGESAVLMNVGRRAALKAETLEEITEALRTLHVAALNSDAANYLMHRVLWYFLVWNEIVDLPNLKEWDQFGPTYQFDIDPIVIVNSRLLILSENYGPYIRFTGLVHAVKFGMQSIGRGKIPSDQLRSLERFVDELSRADYPDASASAHVLRAAIQLRQGKPCGPSPDGHGTTVLSLMLYSVSDTLCRPAEGSPAGLAYLSFGYSSNLFDESQFRRAVDAVRQSAEWAARSGEQIVANLLGEASADEKALQTWSQAIAACESTGGNGAGQSRKLACARSIRLSIEVCERFFLPSEAIAGSLAGMECVARYARIFAPRIEYFLAVLSDKREQ